MKDARHSLAKRIFRTIFIIGAINVLITLGAVEIIYEDMEDTILSLEMAQERAHLESQIDSAEVRTWRSALLSAIYVPDGVTAELPDVFADYPVPFSSEVYFGDGNFLISIQRTADPPGVLYLAQDISLMESRESVVQWAIVILCSGMLLIGLLLSRHGTARVLRPLHELTGEIRNIEPGTAINRIQRDYRERELAEIARTLNEMLDALDAYVKREKALVSLASHELRTPVAVIAGALDVLEQRDSLGEADRRTLSRIRRATDEMHSDIDALLKLARRTTEPEDITPVNLASCVAEVVADIEAFSPDTRGRITCREAGAPLRLHADQALVRMLLRNLIQNAVRHTRAAVEVHIEADRLLIRDHGDGLPARARARLSEPSAHQAVPENGLGLFIVRLICERLGWRIVADSSGPSGTNIALHFDADGPTARTAHL